MATDSTAAGYLAPATAAPYDKELEDVLHGIVAGLTGLSGKFVRPRWTVEPAQRPAFDVDWVAFGITDTQPDAYAYKHQTTTGQEVQKDEVITVLHSFYGPNCHTLASRFRDGFQVEQNRDQMYDHGIKLQEVQNNIHLPALLKEKWVQRLDVRVIYRRRTVRTYPILTITSAQGQLVTDVPIETAITVNP